MSLARPDSRIRDLVPVALATLVGFTVLVGLGLWQLERLGWKRDLLRQIESRAFAAAPQAAAAEAEWPAWRAAEDEFRRVRVQGRFVPGSTVAIHGLAEKRRGQAIQGFYLFTPLRLDDGSTIVVNRGFVPTELRAETMARIEREPELAVVTGLVRAPQERGWFVPENQPGRGEWFVRDIGEIARTQSLARVAPFYIDADATAGGDEWPRGGQTQLSLSNNHLQYAWTWFSLAAALLGVFAAFVRQRLCGPSTDELQPDDPGQDQTYGGEPQRVG